MKKSYFILAILTAVMFSSIAQAQRNYRYEANTDWASEVNLNKEQEKQFNLIRQQNYNKIKRLREEIDAIHEQIIAIYEDEDAQLRAMLKPQQQYRFDKIKEKQREQDGERIPGAKKLSRKRMRNYGGI